MLTGEGLDFDGHHRPLGCPLAAWHIPFPLALQGPVLRPGARTLRAHRGPPPAFPIDQKQRANLMQNPQTASFYTLLSEGKV